MKIEHIAVYTNDIEILKDFYITYFGAVSNEKYLNNTKQFESYFLTFNGEVRLEIMKIPKLFKNDNSHILTGFNHYAFSVGSKEKVIALTNRLRQDGYKIISEPRTTGDGYFESVVLDPDDNKVEITI